MIYICEVGPRDGLQNETIYLSVSQKVTLIEKLIDAGIKKIEAVSFVNPKIVPQMADAEEVMRQVPQDDEIIYAGLVLSPSGMERAIKTSIHHIHVSIASSTTFNFKNVRSTTEESQRELTKVVESSLHLGYHTVTIIGTAFGCPFEGYIEPKKVLDIAESFIESGCREITLADTTGMATPLRVRALIQQFKERFQDEIILGLHFHNTRGLALANIFAGYEYGVTHFDSSIGGLGGCPFAPKAVGNVCTEDLVHMFHQMNIQTDINLEKLIQINHWLEPIVKHPLPGMVAKAGIAFSNSPS